MTNDTSFSCEFLARETWTKNLGRVSWALERPQDNRPKPDITIARFQLVKMVKRLKSRPPGIPVLKDKNPPPLSVKIPENSRYENTAYTYRV